MADGVKISELPAVTAGNISETDWVAVVQSAAGGVTQRAEIQELRTTIGAREGTGSPEGVVTATVGKLYVQTDGTNGKTLWKKRTGTGNTGWELIPNSTGVANAQDYGLSTTAGTGLANRIALQAAIDAVSAARGTVYIPVGEYPMDCSVAAVVIPVGVTVRGEMSRYGGTEFVHQAGAILFDMSGGYEESTLEGVTITQGLAGATGIRVKRFGCRLHRVYFEAWTGTYAVYLDEDASGGPYLTHISDLIIRCWTGTAGTIDYGVFAAAAFNGGSITRFTINGAKIAAIEIRGANSLTIASGTCENNKSGTGSSCGIVIGNSTPSIASITVQDIYFENNDRDVWLIRGSDIKLMGIYAQGNTAAYGIYIDDASGTGANLPNVTIIGGRLFQHSSSNIHIIGTTNVLIINPHLALSVTTGAGGGSSTISGTSIVGQSATFASSTTTPSANVGSTYKSTDTVSRGSVDTVASTIFTGATQNGTQSGYLLVVSGTLDANSSFVFTDVVHYMTSGGFNVLSTLTTSASARTYSVSGTALQCAVAAGGPYSVNVRAIRMHSMAV